MSQKEGIRYIDSILAEVYNETPFSRKEVDEAWKIHLEHVKSLMDDPGVLRINIPFLGVLYFSTYKAMAIINRNMGRSDLSKIKDKKKKVEEEVTRHRKFVVESGYVTKYVYPQIRKGGLYKLYKNIKILMGWGGKTSYASKKKLFKILEDYSNNRLKKDE